VRIGSRDERGLTESAQWAVLFSLLLLVTLGIVQAGIYLHGRNVAQRAATAAVDAARGSFGTTAEAHQLAVDIARSGGLEGVTIRITRGSATVSAEVTGQAPTMIDIGISHIRESASAPLERVTQP
jgi:Flp pilus assembly protein TadG